MMPTKNLKEVATSLVLLSIVFSATLAYASTENNYKIDVNVFTGISESTHAENGYKANIIIDPYTTGLHAKESGFILDLTISSQGVGGAFKEGNYRLDLIPEDAFPYWADMGVTKTVSIVGDINGDGKVDMKDVSYVARRFMCVPGDTLWDANADINSDGKIDMKDIAGVAKNFGKTSP